MSYLDKIKHLTQRADDHNNTLQPVILQGGENMDMMSIPMSILARTEIITPEMALDLLKIKGNRPRRRHLVERYLEAMMRGAWVMNGEPIIVGVSGRVLDGQHRLEALVLFGQPLAFLVVRNVQDEERAFQTIDSGTKRSTADWLAGHGECDPKSLSAAVRWIHKYLHVPGSKVSSVSPDKGTIEHVLNQYPDIREWIPKVGKLRPAGFNPPMMCMIFCAATRYSKKLAEEFAEDCIEGAGLAKSNPAFLLRARIIQSKVGSSRLRPLVEFALCIKAWNAYASSAPMKLLRYDSATEEFPSIVGFPFLNNT